MSRGPMRVNLAARAATAEARRQRTRARLLDAAEAVIAERGPDAASIEDLVRAARVSRGTFYNYFPTVTDLVHALNQRIAVQMARELQPVADRDGSPAARLAASFHAVIAACAADPVRGWVAVQLATSRAPRQAPFEQQFAALYREGVRAGCFRDVELAAALTVCFGAMRMAQRDAVTGAAAPARSVQVVALLLAAFGVPYDEAERISREEAVATRR